MFSSDNDGGADNDRCPNNNYTANYRPVNVTGNVNGVNSDSSEKQ